MTPKDPSTLKGPLRGTEWTPGSVRWPSIVSALQAQPRRLQLDQGPQWVICGGADRVHTYVQVTVEEKDLLPPSIAYISPQDEEYLQDILFQQFAVLVECKRFAVY